MQRDVQIILHTQILVNCVVFILCKYAIDRWSIYSVNQYRIYNEWPTIEKHIQKKKTRSEK